MSSEKNFPWKTLPGELIHLGMVIKGYPEDVLLPGGFHTSANKGIANLTLKETGIMIAALRAGTMRIKKVSEGTKGTYLIGLRLGNITSDIFTQLNSSLQIPQYLRVRLLRKIPCTPQDVAFLQTGNLIVREFHARSQAWLLPKSKARF